MSKMWVTHFFFISLFNVTNLTIKTIIAEWKWPPRPKVTSNNPCMASGDLQTQKAHCISCTGRMPTWGTQEFWEHFLINLWWHTRRKFNRSLPTFTCLCGTVLLTHTVLFKRDWQQGAVLFLSTLFYKTDKNKQTKKEHLTLSSRAR